jgi:hypothetical protein
MALPTKRRENIKVHPVQFPCGFHVFGSWLYLLMFAVHSCVELLHCK